MVEDWVAEMDEGGVVNTCYLDIQKAFDTVPHKRLMAKVDS